MKIAGAIALVTGANRGLGLAFAKAFVEMGAAYVPSQGLALQPRRSTLPILTSGFQSALA